MKRGETPFKEVTEVMSVESFENKVANGEELVLLDDNVLDKLFLWLLLSVRKLVY